MISGWRWRRSIVSAGRHMLVVVFIIIRCAAIFRHLMVSCCWHCCRYRLVCRLGFTDGGDMAAQDNCLQHICRAKDTKLPIWAAKSFVWAGAAPARGRRQAAFSLLAPLIVDACSDLLLPALNWLWPQCIYAVLPSKTNHACGAR